MKNTKETHLFPLCSLIDKLREGRFVIPDFQREFEWSPWDIRNLMKSIFLDYYIGTLQEGEAAILWFKNVVDIDFQS